MKLACARTLMTALALASLPMMPPAPARQPWPWHALPALPSLKGGSKNLFQKDLPSMQTQKPALPAAAGAAKVPAKLTEAQRDSKRVREEPAYYEVGIETELNKRRKEAREKRMSKLNEPEGGKEARKTEPEV